MEENTEQINQKVSDIEDIKRIVAAWFIKLLMRLFHKKVFVFVKIN